MNTETKAEVIPAAKNQIAEFDEFEAGLVKLEEEFGKRVYDMTDPEQEAEARSDRMMVAKTQTAFKKVRLAAKETAQERVNLVNTLGKSIDDRMEAVKMNSKGQIDKRDKEIEEHAEMLQGKVDAIRELGEDCESLNANGLKERINDLTDIDVDDSYEDREADATLAYVNQLAELEGLLARRIKDEAEQVELEALRKEKVERERKDREEQIRKDAEAKATREAEEKAGREQQKLIDDALEAESKARQEIEEANRKQEEAEAATERAAQEEREKMKREREGEEARVNAKRVKEEKAKAKTEHREKIRNAAYASLVKEACDNCNLAEEIIEAIANDEIDHVSINY